MRQFLWAKIYRNLAVLTRSAVLVDRLFEEIKPEFLCFAGVIPIGRRALRGFDILMA